MKHRIHRQSDLKLIQNDCGINSVLRAQVDSKSVRHERSVSKNLREAARKEM